MNNSNSELNLMSARIPWLTLVGIYCTQYIGLTFIMASTVAILRQQQVELDRLAVLNLIAIPIAGKIIYASFVDRFDIGFIKGKYRAWLLLAQFTMLVLMFIIGFVDISHQFSTLIILLFVYTVAVGFQDVSIDGLACKLFTQNQRQLANSLQISSNLLGHIIGGGLLLVFYEQLLWQGTTLLVTALTFVAFLQVYFLNESAFVANNNEPINSQVISFKRIGKELLIFIKTHRLWLLILIMYPLGFSTVIGMINPMLVDAGWQLKDIGVVTKIFGAIIGVMSALSAAWLINKLGRKRALLYLTIAQAIAMAFVLPMAMGYSDKTMVYIAIAAYSLVNPAVLATLATHVMDKAADTSAKATFFSLQMSLTVFSGFTFSGLALFVAKHIGYEPVVVFAVICNILVAILFGYIHQRNSHNNNSDNIT